MVLYIVVYSNSNQAILIDNTSGYNHVNLHFDNVWVHGDLALTPAARLHSFEGCPEGHEGRSLQMRSIGYPKNPWLINVYCVFVSSKIQFYRVSSFFRQTMTNDFRGIKAGARRGLQ